MRVKQLSVFLQNKSGRLAAATRALGARGINIRALCLADTADFGVARFIVSDPVAAAQALKDEDFATALTDVLVVEIPDEPGGLSRVLEVLGEAGADVEYLYAFCEKHERSAMVIFRVEKIDLAVEALCANNVAVVPSQTVYDM
ncbi:MAG TPA: ACT domain-containing protein [Armatimonadota bacterium]